MKVKDLMTRTVFICAAEDPVLAVAKKSMPKENPYLLPTSCKPLRYDLFLEPNIEQGICAGQEIIAVEIGEPTTTITLNVNEVKILEAKAANQNAAITYD